MPPKPIALLNTSTLVVETFDTMEQMRAYRAALVIRGEQCVTFKLEDGNYWIDGMTGKQLGRVLEAISDPASLRPVVEVGGPNG